MITSLGYEWRREICRKLAEADASMEIYAKAAFENPYKGYGFWGSEMPLLKARLKFCENIRQDLLSESKLGYLRIVNSRITALKDYSRLPQVWVVVVLESDPDGPGTAKREYRYAEVGNGRLYDDGTCFLYANAAYRGDDDLGRLMADFCESDPDKIRDDLLRERVEYLKRDPKGVAEMCRISDEIYNEGVQDGIEQGARDRLLDNVRSLMETVGWTAQEALERLKVPATEQKRYLSML